MVAISYTEKNIVEVGDIFMIDSLYIQLLSMGSDSFGLLDIVESDVFLKDFRNIDDAVNHIKEVYGEFKLIKSNRVELSIK